MVGSFSEGFAHVMKNKKYGFIDKTGNEVYPCVYDNVWGFSHGRAQAVKDGKYGYIGNDGIWHYDSYLNEGKKK
jgi:hypothetical protein